MKQNHTNFKVSKVTVLTVLVFGAHGSDIFKFERRWGATGLVKPWALPATMVRKTAEE